MDSIANYSCLWNAVQCTEYIQCWPFHFLFSLSCIKINTYIPLIDVTVFTLPKITYIHSSRLYWFWCLKICELGWAQWNLSRFEFKFDNAKLSLWYKNKICQINFLFVAPWRCSVSAQLASLAETAHKAETILLLYYEESLISSNLNSKLFRFHSVRPNIQKCIRF